MREITTLTFLGVLGLASCASQSSSIATTPSAGLESVYVVDSSGGA